MDRSTNDVFRAYFVILDVNFDCSIRKLFNRNHFEHRHNFDVVTGYCANRIGFERASLSVNDRRCFGGFLCVYASGGDTAECDCIRFGVFNDTQYAENRYLDEYSFDYFNCVIDLFWIAYYLGFRAE